MSFLEASRELWDGHARRDPLWAILSDPAKKGGKWDLHRFFQTGAGEIALRFYQVRAHGVAIDGGAALDFGCGVGRLTQALAPHFVRVVGVDVSPEMIAHATRLNRTPQSVSYVVNDAAHLGRFDDHTFAFIVSNIVLQHIQPDISMGYVREFLRILAPGGVLIFQLPSHLRGEGDQPPPPSAAAMPDEAYVAWLGARIAAAPSLSPGSSMTIDVEVTNRSGFEWNAQAFGVIRVGNHWLDASGRMLVRDDGRSALPNAVPSGETCVVPLTVTVPADEGDYLCEIDLAHEGVTWFGDKASPTLRWAARVRRDASERVPERHETRAAGERVEAEPAYHSGEAAGSEPPAISNPAAPDPGDFPMYGVPTREVRALLAAGGGDLFHVEDDRSCGDDWVSYRYFVKKRPGDLKA